jgi:hypothetical protein
VKVEDLIGVIGLLPESWRPWALLVLEVMPLVAAALMFVKAKMGTPDPERDSWGRTFAFWALMALDWLALNSTPIREKLRQQAGEREKRRMSIPPGGGR